MRKIIVIGSQKDGVGKITTIFNLAYILSKLEKKVLVVDFDSQANLTICYGIEKNILRVKVRKRWHQFWKRLCQHSSPKREKVMAERIYNFIDLFAGCGGLNEGFYKQNFKALVYLKIDYYACETLKTRMRH